ncbi:MAG: hypothetical protein ACR2LL_08800 [Nitrosopumilus sp.]
MTNKTILMGITLSAVLALTLTMTSIGTALANAVDPFLEISKAEIEVDDEELEAELETHGIIPTDGTGGAFGYGVITGAGLEAIIVATSHPGVLDSDAQEYILDPVMHSHFVALQDSQTGGTGLCPGPEVRDITWEEPAEVDVSGDEIEIEEVPTDGFSGTHSITGDPVSFNMGTDVGNVVSFRLAPVFNAANGLQAVCVNIIDDSPDELEIEEDD